MSEKCFRLLCLLRCFGFDTFNTFSYNVKTIEIQAVQSVFSTKKQKVVQAS